jgi:hypothetical protein
MHETIPRVLKVLRYALELGCKTYMESERLDLISEISLTGPYQAKHNHNGSERDCNHPKDPLAVLNIADIACVHAHNARHRADGEEDDGDNSKCVDGRFPTILIGLDLLNILCFR